MDEMLSGPYRRITHEQAAELDFHRCEWAEGCGWVVYDELAREQFQIAIGVRRPAALQHEAQKP